jgi:hypothetical protein
VYLCCVYYGVSMSVGLPEPDGGHIRPKHVVHTD